MESDQYETIAGWLIDTVDAVPLVGDEFVVKGYRFKVRSMRRRRICELHVTKLVEGESDAGEAAA